MRFGLTLMIADGSITAVQAAQAAEERGFESMWVGEHTHMPVATSFHYSSGKYAVGKTTREGHLPDWYRLCVDPYVTLAAAAVATTTLRIGTCIALPGEHNPLVLAKTIATLDQLSGGRFEFGIGYGWNALEMENNGVDPSKRRSTTREKVLALKALWTQESASFDGRYVSFTESWSRPKPAQSPYPPILLGAAGTDRNLDAIAEYCDGWFPVRVFIEDDDLTPYWDKLRGRAEAHGRDADQFQITMFDPQGATTGRRSREAFLDCLTPASVIDSYREQGVHRFNFAVPVDDLGEYTWSLDRISERLHELDG